jgi:hypothetical protein
MGKNEVLFAIFIFLTNVDNPLGVLDRVLSRAALDFRLGADRESGLHTGSTQMKTKEQPLSSNSAWSDPSAGAGRDSRGAVMESDCFRLRGRSRRST